MRKVTLRGCLVLLAAAATSLILVSSAFAASFAAENYPAYVASKATSGSEFKFGLLGTTCQAQKAEGDTISSPSETVGPVVGDATCDKGSLKMNSCKFIFHAGPAGTGTVEIGPTGCGQMVVTESTCERSFAPQSFPASYENVGTGSSATVKVRINAANLTYSYGSGCGKAGTATATYSANWELSATYAGTANGLRVAPSAIYLSGEGGSQPKLNAEAYPTPIAGSQSAAQTLQFGIRKFNCTSITFGGELSAAASEVSLSAQYAGCQATGGLPATVAMNSCHYTLDVLNVGPPYAGSLDVACSKEGDGIEAKAWASKAAFEEGKAPLCTYTVAPQSGLTSVALENIGTGIDRQVAVTLGLSDIEYSISGPALSCGTTKTKGTYSGGTTLHGL